MRIVLFFLATLIAAAPATGDTLVRADAEQMADVIRDVGFKAVITTDSDGDPMIKSSSQGADWSILFYGCTGGQTCTSVQFSAAFDLTDPMSGTPINDWNRDRRYGKAYLDAEGDPYLEMDVDLTHGVSVATFANTVQT